MENITEKFIGELFVSFIFLAGVKLFVDFSGGINISWIAVILTTILLGIISLLDEVTYILDFWNNFNFLFVHIILIFTVAYFVGWDPPVTELSSCDQLQTSILGKPKSSFTQSELREIRIDYPYEYRLYFETNVGVCGVCNIKGNHSFYGDWIYHMPWQQYYNATVPEEWFCTERQAIQARYRKSLR